MSKVRMFDTPREVHVVRVVEWILEDTLLTSDTVQVLLHPQLSATVVGSPQSVGQSVRYTYRYDDEHDFVSELMTFIESLEGMYGLLSSVEVPGDTATYRIPFIQVTVSDEVSPIEWVKSGIPSIPAPFECLYLLTSKQGPSYLYGDRLVSVREWNQFLDCSLGWYTQINGARRTHIADVDWVRRTFARGMGLAQICTQAPTLGRDVSPYTMLVTSMIDG